MKNFNEKNDQIRYKEVVIVGNGPSGISLSYFLAGNWPYWKTEELEAHPDELLRARLRFSDENKSLIEHDLFELAQGLEGRTTNPVSLLFDNLQHPGADLGMNLPSMLKYKHHKDKEIDHVVLGKGEPGGSWHRMDKNLRTLSLSAWMSLPNLNYDDWLQKKSLNDDDNSCDANSSSHCLDEDFTNDNCVNAQKNHSINENTVSEEVKTRALVHHVADYYADYVHLMNLDNFFWNDTVVLNIRQIKETEKCKLSINAAATARWIVQGFDRANKKPFLMACNKVVLANGGSDLANRLGVKGENKSLSWLKYELPLLERAIMRSERSSVNVKPVLIVGAGLSAADAIIACRNAGIEVIHVYRGVAAGFMGLPQAHFPEYNMVYRMMRNPREKYDLYKAIPESTLKEIKTVNGCHHVTIQKNNNEEFTFDVSYLAILIGSRPNLSFLANITTKGHQQHNHNSYNNDNNNINNRNMTNVIINNSNDTLAENFAIRSLRRLKIFCDKCRHLNLCFGNRNRNLLLNNSFIEDTQKNNCPQQKNCECEYLMTTADRNTINSKVDDTGIGFGEDTKKPIDCKNNPIAVNKFTNEFSNVPGIFAMGPLVGDNFVRFIGGGALSISSYLYSEKS